MYGCEDRFRWVRVRVKEKEEEEEEEDLMYSSGEEIESNVMDQWMDGRRQDRKSGGGFECLLNRTGQGRGNRKIEDASALLFSQSTFPLVLSDR
jgi:hypothetical protein